ncbi:hypothetical protein NLN48_24875, partial [Escherichia coli]|uniref:hypothetical protein n=1 Tax=Escherichia coli TaxID=562 RepID=UPI0020B3261F
DRNRSHWSTSKTPSYTKSVSWQHHPSNDAIRKYIKKTVVINEDGKQCVKTNLNFRKTDDGMVIYISALNRHAI